MVSVCQHKKNIMVLYPYGGTDFGSFMLFVVSLDIICITALLFATTLCNYPVLSFKSMAKEQIFIANIYLAVLENHLFKFHIYRFYFHFV